MCKKRHRRSPTCLFNSYLFSTFTDTRKNPCKKACGNGFYLTHYDYYTGIDPPAQDKENGPPCLPAYPAGPERAASLILALKPYYDYNAKSPEPTQACLQVGERTRANESYYDSFVKSTWISTGFFPVSSILLLSGWLVPA